MLIGLEYVDKVLVVDHNAPEPNEEVQISSCLPNCLAKCHLKARTTQV